MKIRAYVIAALIAVIGYLAVDEITSNSRSAVVSPWYQQLVRLKSFGMMMGAYQVEHEVPVWPDWNHLLVALDSSLEPTAMFIDPSTGKPQPWLYLAEGKSTAEQEPKTVLVAAPLVKQEKAGSDTRLRRAVLWSDFTAEFIDEAEFQSLLKGQR